MTPTPAALENVTPTATAVTLPTAEPQPTESPSAVPEATVESVEATLAPTAVTMPPSPVFDRDWDDREPFRATLISGEQDILTQLPGATVYHMDLVIEAGFNTVSGRLAARYTNQENVALPFIYLHLHPNLLGGAIEASNLTVDGKATTPIFESFNDSVMRIPLAAPLQPGEQAVIALDFLTTVPREPGPNYGIFVHSDGVLTLAHFYPLFAVYDEEAWNVAAPDSDGDVTYSDTSFYLVRVTAPAAPVIVASGTAIENTTAGETQTITFAAGPMRDFYMVLSDRYTAVERQVGATRITSYAPAEFGRGAELALDTAAAALQSFSERFGVYPFSELDVAATPTLALGVEYPGVIVGTLRVYDLEANNSGISDETLLESTTAHEVAHQWFYSLIGNDQLDEPWLDESITQYATYLYFLDRYGPAGGEGYTGALDQRWARVNYEEIPIGLPVAAYEGAEYGAIVYGRGPLFLQALAERIGEETFAAFLQAYYSQYAYNIATTEDFRALAEQHCQCNLEEIFSQWVYE